MAPGSTVDEVTRLRHIVETQRAIDSAPLDREYVIRVVTERAQAVTGAQGGAVGLVEGDDMVYRAVSGMAQAWAGTRLKVAGSLSGRCVRLGVPMRCVDAEYDARVDRSACRRFGVRSVAVVPVLKGGVPVGVLEVVSAEADHFGESDVEILQEMARFAADSLGRRAADAPLGAVGPPPPAADA